MRLNLSNQNNRLSKTHSTEGRAGIKTDRKKDHSETLSGHAVVRFFQTRTSIDMGVMSAVHCLNINHGAKLDLLQ